MSLVKRKTIPESESESELSDNAIVKYKNKKQKNIKVPGGILQPTTPGTSSIFCDNVNREVIQRIRSYLNMCISTSKQIIDLLCDSGNINKASDTVFQIPELINQMCRYNNIYFKNVLLYKSKKQLFEPLWYTIVIETSCLYVFIDESLYNEFCKFSFVPSLPVLINTGSFLVDQFNSDAFDSDKFNVPTCVEKVIVACDHLTQHIINDIYGKKIDNSDILLNGINGIHDNWTEHGTTLHSMFELFVSTKKEKTKEYHSILSPFSSSPIYHSSALSTTTNTTTLLNCISSTPIINSTSVI
ncbi:unknown [Gryllus bimaculatus nudivirus]|uniref:Uncharacterized protein n=1 Tax=Gryllus bimaculatus nudivirus TaxID=432587 RepID=A4L1X6_9VIRU|nr:hypothetical protein GrBNV_gp13 [Gryllus bimaculatus nudivirus]ABO45346.1 unknown [Gryllus bimaculatus nudivirus]